MTYRRSPRRLISVPVSIVAFVALLLSLLLGLLPMGAIAQPAGRAPVVLDGNQLFQLSASGEFTAAERAELVNSRLRELTRSLTPVEVTVVERNQLSAILANDQYLLTVTERDALPGSDPQRQASLWADQLEAAVTQAQYYRTGRYIRWALLLTAGIVAIALMIHWALAKVWQRTVRPSINRLMPATDASTDTHASRSLGNLLSSLLLAGVRTLLWLATILYLTNLFPLTRAWTYRILDILFASFTSPILTLGDTGYSIVNLLLLGMMVFLVIVFSKTVTNLLNSRILNFTGVHRGAREAIAIVFRYTFIFIGTLVLLQVWGLDISSLAILASAISVGIGFGLQDIAKNFGSGLVLVFERPIQVGDFIEVGEFQGTVERIGARSTLIRTLDQVSIIVPNSRFLEKEVINWSHDNPLSRLHVPVGVAYGSDIAKVRSLLFEAAKNNPSVLSTPKPQVFFKGFGDSSLNFDLLFWTAEPSKQFPLKSDLYFRIEELFRQNDIEIPFPQRDVHLKLDRLPLDVSPELQQVMQRWVEQRSPNGRDSG